MEIKRTTEILVETNRRLVIRRAEEEGEQFFCPRCNEPMLSAEQTAVVCSISRREVYKHVETGAAHFAETETGAVMICLPSLAAIIEAQKSQIEIQQTQIEELKQFVCALKPDAEVCREEKK